MLEGEGPKWATHRPVLSSDNTPTRPKKKKKRDMLGSAGTLPSGSNGEKTSPSDQDGRKKLKTSVKGKRKSKQLNVEGKGQDWDMGDSGGAEGDEEMMLTSDMLQEALSMRRLKSTGDILGSVSKDDGSRKKLKKKSPKKKSSRNSAALEKSATGLPMYTQRVLTPRGMTTKTELPAIDNNSKSSLKPPSPLPQPKQHTTDNITEDIGASTSLESDEEAELSAQPQVVHEPKRHMANKTLPPSYVASGPLSPPPNPTVLVSSASSTSNNSSTITTTSTATSTTLSPAKSRTRSGSVQPGGRPSTRSFGELPNSFLGRRSTLGKGNTVVSQGGGKAATMRAGLSNVFAINGIGSISTTSSTARAQPADYFDDGSPKASSSGKLHIMRSSRDKAAKQQRNASSCKAMGTRQPLSY